MDECIFFGCMDECIFCGCYDPDLGCTCPSVDKFYVCSLEPELTAEDFKSIEDKEISYKNKLINTKNKKEL